MQLETGQRVLVSLLHAGLTALALLVALALTKISVMPWGVRIIGGFAAVIMALWWLPKFSKVEELTGVYVALAATWIAGIGMGAYGIQCIVEQLSSGPPSEGKGLLLMVSPIFVFVFALLAVPMGLAAAFAGLLAVGLFDLMPCPRRRW
jgi:hypothetical protein